MNSITAIHTLLVGQTSVFQISDMEGNPLPILVTIVVATPFDTSDEGIQKITDKLREIADRVLGDKSKDPNKTVSTIGRHILAYPDVVKVTMTIGGTVSLFFAKQIIETDRL